jgi:hypothetical protein
MSELREQLKKDMASAPWSVLKAHHKRGALVLVAPELDLIDVGEAVMLDQTDRVQAWMNQHQVSPFPDRIAEQQPNMRCLIAQPWVLTQELSPS